MTQYGSFVGLVTLLCAGCASGWVHTERHRIGNWTTTVRADRFSQTRDCRLETKKGKMLYQPGALGFRVSGHGSSGIATDAVYRVDWGTPVHWSDRYPALLHDGVQIENGGLADPTGGIVWIPEAELRNARSVYIRLGDRDPTLIFRLGPLDQAITALDGLHCTTAVPTSF